MVNWEVYAIGVGTAASGYGSMEGGYLLQFVVLDGCWGDMCGT